MGLLKVDGDPEEELDKPGTTIGTKFSALQMIRIPFLNEMWFLTIDPFVGIPVFIAKLSKRQYCWRVFEDFHSQEYIQSFDIHNCLFMRLHFSIGGFDYRMTDAPEPTTNSRSSGIRVDAGRHLFSGDEKNVALWCSFNLNTFLASFHAASRAPCSCHSVSSCERSSNFGALGLRS